MRLPSGDHASSLTPFGMVQACRASPPCAGIRYNCGLSLLSSPASLEVKASCELSGDQRGQLSWRPLLLSGFWFPDSPPDVSTTQIVLRLLRWPVAQSDTSNARSEEHTSELQSRQYLVCRL